MKTWIDKLIDSLGLESEDGERRRKKKPELSDERATLLYLIDVYSKHLVEIEGHPVRKTRETFDEFARELLQPTAKVDPEKLLFRLRQFVSTYRVDEYTYVRKTFEDFKGILWDFVDHLAEEARVEHVADKDVLSHLRQLKEAVESESIDILRTKSREFIDSYVEYQTKKDQRRSKRMTSIKKNLDTVKKRLVEADRAVHTDHLTGAFNRKSFDERVKQSISLQAVSGGNVTLCMLDIDFFKKINDTYGHDIGDFVLKECVRVLQESYGRQSDFVARIGGEEFAIILQDHALEHAVKRAEEVFARIRREAFIHEDKELRFTISMGIAQLVAGETADQWIKRADQALYDSKHGGRNKWTVSTGPVVIKAA